MKIALTFADRMMELLHLTLILFCLVGWAFPATRALHLLVVLLILVTWFGPARRAGVVHCPLTTLHWCIKRLLGSFPATSAFVGHELEKLVGVRISARRADRITEFTLYLLAMISLVANALAAGIF